MNYSREILYHRHRLSHQQINDMLGEQQNQLVFEDKLYQLSHLSKFLEIAGTFIQKNIWFLPLKGPMLSYRIYNDATCRISRDFDFLIKRKDVALIMDMFRNMGFKFDDGKWPENGSLKKQIESTVNQLTFYHSEKQITVEIHWRMFNDPIIDFNEIEKVSQENIRQFDFAGKKMNRFTLEFELLYLIIHGGLHWWRRLKWLVDVQEIINRFQIDKSKFEQLTELFGAQRMVGLCNAMLRHFFPGTQLLPVDYTVPEWFQRIAIEQAERKEDSPDYRLASIFKIKWYLFHAFPSRGYKRKKLYVSGTKVHNLIRQLTLALIPGFRKLHPTLILTHNRKDL